MRRRLIYCKKVGGGNCLPCLAPPAPLLLTPLNSSSSGSGNASAAVPTEAPGSSGDMVIDESSDSQESSEVEIVEAEAVVAESQEDSETESQEAETDEAYNR